MPSFNRKKRKRRGDLVYIEHVDPQKGSMVTFGILTDWIDEQGRSCNRNKSVCAIAEVSKPVRIIDTWSQWAEDHAFVLSPFLDDDPFSLENVETRFTDINGYVPRLF